MEQIVLPVIPNEQNFTFNHTKHTGHLGVDI